MQTFEVPLSAEPQVFQIALAAVTYQLSLQWNEETATWVLDIRDENQQPIVTGIPLVTGADLLGQYTYLNFGGQLYAETVGDLSTPPTFENLGDEGKVYFRIV